jgi:hypothetical protein
MPQQCSNFNPSKVHVFLTEHIKVQDLAIKISKNLSPHTWLRRALAPWSQIPPPTLQLFYYTPPPIFEILNESLSFVMYIAVQSVSWGGIA